MARRWRSDVDPMYVTLRRGRRARLEGPCFPEGGARARPLRWARPAPRSARGSPLLTWCFSGLLGAPARLRGSCVGPWLPRRPPIGARFIVVRPFFHMFCGGAFPAPFALRRNSSAIWPPLLFPPAAGCPCRAPAGAPSPAPGGPLLCRSPFGRHSGVPPGVFFGWRLVLRSGGQGVSPRCGGPRFAPLTPCPSARHLLTVFVRPGGPGLVTCRARGWRPYAPRGGRPAAPLHPGRRRRAGRCFS